MIPIILLSREEYDCAVWIGRIRQEEDDLRGLKTKFEMNDSNKFEKNELGALCEMAFWKFLFPLKTWDPAPMKCSDVGDFQVRGTAPSKKVSAKECKLVIRQADWSSDRIAMVIQFSKFAYIVRGWITASDGRKVGVKRNPNGFHPAHFVNQSNLNLFRQVDVYTGTS